MKRLLKWIIVSAVIGIVVALILAAITDPPYRPFPAGWL